MKCTVIVLNMNTYLKNTHFINFNYFTKAKKYLYYTQRQIHYEFLIKYFISPTFHFRDVLNFNEMYLSEYIM